MVGLCAAWAMWLAVPSHASGQQQTIQLPSFDVFSIQTTVIVPDGGTALLGSIGRAAMGESVRGVPLLSSVPGLNRGFRNRAFGSDSSRSTATVSAQILSLQELGQQVLAEGNQRLAARPDAIPEATRRRAEFLSRNVGGHRR